MEWDRGLGIRQNGVAWTVSGTVWQEPSHHTINWVTQMIDSEKFHEFFSVDEGCAGAVSGVVSIDGQTVRHSRDEAGGQRPIHVVSAWACEVFWSFNEQRSTLQKTPAVIAHL